VMDCLMMIAMGRLMKSVAVRLEKQDSVEKVMSERALMGANL
jgi:hypothetical protein